MKNILIPIDGSDGSMRALEKGKEIAQSFDSNVILLHVRPALYVSDYEMNILHQYQLGQYESIANTMILRGQELTNHAQEILDRGLDVFSELDANKVSTVILEGKPAFAIIDYLESKNDEIDLVIMGSQGLTAGKVHQLFIGSVTHKVLNGVKQPILVIK
ncbi:universal stress protein [Irregularibacter muris]|uniref:Universal stress protein n=1 Tax=Irregularibacter muris TaxID=1796619 RepID=A0AAE3HHZ1_9FIRM|nr:universal stress protein [Irregularibacter muris]MCR1899735.1 universal stress protein [Irregularibacter muris]